MKNKEKYIVAIVICLMVMIMLAPFMIVVLHQILNIEAFRITIVVLIAIIVFAIYKHIQ